jgi:hypothetical protein
MRRTLRAAAWFAGLVALLVALRAAAGGALEAPPPGPLDELRAWADDRGAAATFALVRLAAEAATWYLLGLSVLELLGGLGRRRRRGIVELVTAPGARRLVRSGLGLGLVASTSVPVSPALASAPPGTAAMQPVDDDTPSGTARMVPIAPSAAPAPPPPPRPTGAAVHRVEPGESFWSIASETLAAAWGRTPTDAEIDPFWRELVARNRHRLVTGDPDLVLPGQVFELPAVPSPA